MRDRNACERTEVGGDCVCAVNLGEIPTHHKRCPPPKDPPISREDILRQLRSRRFDSGGVRKADLRSTHCRHSHPPTYPLQSLVRFTRLRPPRSNPSLRPSSCSHIPLPMACISCLSSSRARATLPPFFKPRCPAPLALHGSLLTCGLKSLLNGSQGMTARLIDTHNSKSSSSACHHQHLSPHTCCFIHPSSIPD